MSNKPKPRTGEVTLTRAKLFKDGTAAYVLSGVRGRLVVKGSMFGTAAPETLTLAFDGFAEPDVEALARAEARIKRTLELAKKAADRATKLQAKAEALAAKQF